MIRIKWSDLEKHKPINVQIDKLSESKLYANKQYLLFNACFDFGDDGTRPIELSVPVAKFNREFKKLKMSTQTMINEHKVKFKLVKLDKGYMRIKDIEKVME